MQQNKKNTPFIMEANIKYLHCGKGSFFNKLVLGKQISMFKIRKCVPTLNSIWIKALDIKPEIETTRRNPRGIISSD